MTRQLIMQMLEALGTCNESMSGTRFKEKSYNELKVATTITAAKEYLASPSLRELTDEEILKAISPKLWLHIEGQWKSKAIADGRAVLAAQRSKLNETL